MPWILLRGLVGYICSSWKTLTLHQQQTPGDLGIALFPIWPSKCIKDFTWHVTKCTRHILEIFFTIMHLTNLDGTEVHWMFDDVVIVV